jgi:hypothetical protein
MLLTSINFGDGNCAYSGEDYYKFINGFALKTQDGFYTNYKE